MATYIDCSGKEQILDEFHYHEMLDRIHCISVMWEEMIVNHAGYKEMCGKYGDVIGAKLGELYQNVGRQAHDYRDS